MVLALIKDRMRPGLIMFSGAVVFLCAGILTPKELLEGFANKGMITVAMLFLVSEGVRQSGALGQLIKKLLPERRSAPFGIARSLATQSVATEKPYGRAKGAGAYVANDCFYIGLFEQYACGGNLCPNDKALG